MNRDQVVQSLLQFLTVAATGLAVYEGVPTSLDQLWQPFIQGVVAALLILGGSKVPKFPRKPSP